jgi:hypothetical protein
MSESEEFVKEFLVQCKTTCTITAKGIEKNYKMAMVTTFSLCVRQLSNGEVCVRLLKIIHRHR